MLPFMLKRDEEQRLRALRRHGLLDEDGHVVDFNPVAERLLAREPGSLPGCSFEALVLAPERDAWRQALEEVRARGTARRAELGLMRSGGERLSIQDDRLAAVGALAAGVAHEINNPIAYVLANLGFLQRWRDELERELPTGLPAQVKEMLSEAREVLAESLEGCQRIGDIVRDMRFFAHAPDEADGGRVARAQRAGPGEHLQPVSAARALHRVAAGAGLVKGRG
jgi:two-component system, NtrC family, sensor kinase